MEPLFQHLYNDFMAGLRRLAGEESGLLLQSKKSAEAAVRVIEKLREHVTTHPFKNKEEEIAFFREVKPLFQCRLIYWLKILQYELNKPAGTPADREAYILQELRTVDIFFDNNREFYRYWRFGYQYNDPKYFTRGTGSGDEAPDLDLLDRDPVFSTSHDQKLASILAYEMLADFFNSELEARVYSSPDFLASRGDVPAINWTAPKTGLIELMYAFNSCGAFNNGQASINQLAELFERIFNVKLGNYYRTFQEIRIRKKGRTAFLDQMRDKLIDRMDEADENPR